MVDIFLIGVREEDKADFIVELIKELMSRGLTISYAGAYYCESEDSFVYDDVTNLLFFSSTYFREAQMKSRNFGKWVEFLENIDFEQIDVKLIIYVSTCIREIEYKDYLGKLEKDFDEFLQDYWKDRIVELIRDSFMMSFSAFESYHPEIVEVLGIDLKLLHDLRIQVEEYTSEIETEWESEVYSSFISNCRKIRDEMEKSGLTQIGIELRERRTFMMRLPEEIRNFRKEYINLKKDYIDEMEKKERFEEDLREIQKQIDQLEGKKEFAPLEDEIFEKGKPEYGTLKELRKSQENLEIELSEDPSKSKELVGHFFDSQRIGEAARNPERAMYYDIQNRAPKKKILSIFYEEEKEEEINLFFYRAKPTEEEIRKSIDINRTPRSRLGGFERPRDVYEHENIERVVDDYIMLALHPSIVDIRFPDNHFALEVDPEEPEIGFLSRRITMSRFETICQNLNINLNLGNALCIYRLARDDKEGVDKRFYRIGCDYETNNLKEDVLILGRIEQLNEILIDNNFLRNIYHYLPIILRGLAILLPPLAIILYLFSKYLFPSQPEPVSNVFWAVGALTGTSFAFWTLRTFTLSYILEPIYNRLKWFSFVCLALIILGKIEFFGIEFLVVFFAFLLFLAGILSAKYIRSAVFYELNESLGIMGYNDNIEIKSVSDVNDVENLKVLKCGRFQTIIKKKDENERDAAEVSFNSEIFPKIRCVHKKTRTFPREMAYSSGIYLHSKDQEEKDRFVEELVFRKPKAWGSWRILKNIFFDKGRIESRKEIDYEYSPSERLIYFGQWNSVMKRVAGSIPLFPQSLLFRGMIILAVVSVLIFNFLFSHDMSEIGLLEIALFSIISFFFISIAWKLKFQLWKIFLVLILCLLLLSQPHDVIIMAALLLILSVIFLYLFRFLVKQILFYFMIWAYEKCGGNIISAINIFGDQDSNGDMKSFQVMRGAEIRINPLITQLFMRFPSGLEERQIYYNETFFHDFILSDKWHLKTDADNDSTACKTLFFFVMCFMEYYYRELKKWLRIRR